MPELDWQRYLERRALVFVAPLRAIQAVLLLLLLRRAPRLLWVGLPAYLLGVLWLLFRDDLVYLADRPGSVFLWPLLLLAGDLACLWMLVGFATGVSRGLLTGQPIAALPRFDRAELRCALAGLPAVLAAGLVLLVLRLPFANWHPMLFLLGTVAPGPFLGRLLLAGLPVCLLLAVLAPLLPAAAPRCGRSRAAAGRPTWRSPCSASRSSCSRCCWSAGSATA
ncbi:hypothetical protein SAMN06265365_101664 [Tistlia consotensis]|uniref:Uncharacterized protein n=1 Tax=Tistlia consotensis USBA 355 TaxID=560819 RepID=A0A1Y6B787_9PROT|nr:hypothetical protein [Tistlia consotensis]SME94258.1 hypothetical protein SAMN05428998_101663 [Tistlia consotensis USBA 355]SNR29212.1 hypothetical protein SAMN06265365_101664 [Tistlia consotensis]